MGQVVHELYIPMPLAATAILTPGASSFGGFFCTTAGTFTLQDASSNTLIPSIALTVGQLVPVTCICLNGIKVVLSGGCAGTALYASAYN